LTSKADEYANNIKNLMALYQKEANELNETKSKAAENKRFLLESYAQSLNFWDTSFGEKEQQSRKQLQDKESEVRNRDSQINKIKEQRLTALKVQSDQVTKLNKKHISELKAKDDEIAKLKKQHLRKLQAEDDTLAKLKKQHLSELKAKNHEISSLSLSAGYEHALQELDKKRC
jgi:hypothetical protein